MSDDYYADAVPEPRTLLGLKLRPLSLGHLILLHRVESSFVLGGSVSFEDLALAIFICSRSYEDSIEAFDDKRLHKFMRRWADKLTGQTFWDLFKSKKKRRSLDLKVKAGEFGEYFTQHTTGPYYTILKEGDGSSECPNVQAVKVCMMRELGFNESEALNRSWLLCLWDYASICEAEGIYRITKRDTIMEAMEAAKRIAEKLNARNGICPHSD